jgi:thioredoxin reductase (NADPH)
MAIRDLLIVGAGPSGLSAAIAARGKGLDYLVLEQGVLVNSIYRFPPQMEFFTTPELLEIGGLPFVSPYAKPTRPEALRYYRRVVEAHALDLRLGEQVLAVRPEPSDAASLGERTLFSVETGSSRGVRRERQARHVLLAIGYFDQPNRLGVLGEDLPHVHHYYSEPYAHFRQHVVIVGGGNSAAEFALQLHRAGVHVTIIHRGASMKPTIKYWVRPDIDNRIAEGSVAAHFDTLLREIRPTTVVVDGPRGTLELPADAVFLLTGYRADGALMTAAGVRLDEREAPVLDPETFETNVPGLFVAGGAIAGIDTGTVFIENGRFHGIRVVDAVAARCGR